MSSSTTQNKGRTILFSLLPILVLLITDYRYLWVTPANELIMSHFIFAVFFAQLLFQLVFYKGQLCNGQRSRLSNFNIYFLIFWGIWFILSLLQVNVFIPLRLTYICGIFLTLTTWKQPKEQQLRHSLLLLGTLVASLGIILALFPLFLSPISVSLIYNPIWQASLAIALCYWGLQLSRSRLQIFISLLPIFAVILLLLSAIFSAGILFYFYVHDIQFIQPIDLSWYFIGHLALLLLWSLPLIRPHQLSWITLLIILVISSSLSLLFY